MIQTRKLHGVSVFVWSFRDNMGFCLFIYKIYSFCNIAENNKIYIFLSLW